MTPVLIAVVALAVLGAGALVRWPLLVAAGLLLGAFAYAIGLHEIHGGAARATSAALVAGGLLVAGELGFGLVVRRGTDARGGPGAWALALRVLAGGLGAAATAVLVLAAAALPLARSLAATAVGTVALVAAAWLLVSAVRGVVADEK